MIIAISLTAVAGCKRRSVHRPIPPPAPLAVKNAAGAAIQNAAGKTALIFSVGFEKNQPLSRFDLSWLHNRWAAKLVSSPVRAGKKALEVSLRRSDEMASKGKRAEIAVPFTYRHQKGYWYGFSVYLPQSWKPDFQGDVVAQWFANHDREIGEKGRSPALALRIRKHKWFVTGRYDVKRLTVGNSGKKVRIYKTRYERGRWTDWAFFVRWSYRKGAPKALQGLVEVYKDGKKVASRRGPNTYNDQRGVVLKLGVYKAPWNDPATPSDVKERLLYLDEVRVGLAGAGLKAVSPPGAKKR
jgi:hypothetical protein